MVISLWTVCLEEQFYIIWGRLLTLISHKRKLIAVIISLLIAAISLRSYVQDHSASHNEYYYNTITHMDPLLMGALLAISWDTFAEKMKPWGSVSFFLSMVIITSIIIYVPDIFQNKKSIIWAMTGIAIAWTLFLFSVITHPVLKRFFSRRPFTELGKITYCMYLIHYPFLITCSAFLHNHMNFLNDFQKWCLIFIVTLSATFFTSRYSWKFYERPFNMLKHNYSRENIEQEFIAPRSRIKFLKASN